VGVPNAAAGKGTSSTVSRTEWFGFHGSVDGNCNVEVGDGAGELSEGPTEHTKGVNPLLESRSLACRADPAAGAETELVTSETMIV
jgi:hypothetical protein